MAEQNKQNSVFEIRKVYIKDASLESPNAPEVFLQEAAQPKIDIDATIKTTSLKQDGYYEVTLGITVTSKTGEDVAFLVEIQQCGVFLIQGIPEEDLPLALEIACPNVLLPFVREAISDLVGKAGFPQLLLAPINFEGLYMQKQQSKQKSEETAKH